jgi:hypothetical protein
VLDEKVRKIEVLAHVYDCLGPYLAQVWESSQPGSLFVPFLISLPGYAEQAVRATGDDFKNAQKDLLDDLSEIVKKAAFDESEVAREILTAVEAFEVREASPISRMFETVCDRSSALYQNQWRPAELSIHFHQHHPRGKADPYALSGRTRATDELATVTIAPCAELLYAEAYAAIPSLLVHECICHVPAIPADDVDNRSPFAEGFLDYAAGVFHERWLKDLAVGFEYSALEHGQRYRSLLAERYEVSGNPGWSARLVGRRIAARISLRAQRSLAMTKFAADTHVARLALELNVADAPLALKDLRIRQWEASSTAGLEVELEEFFGGGIGADDLL